MNRLFQYWLMEMGDRLDELIEEMPAQLMLDYSPESLLRLEEWISKTYPTVGDILKETEKRRVRFFSTIRRASISKKFKWQVETFFR
jgi:hypothetical protein